MIAGWYLILFILTIIFLLFVASFNIYEQERIKRKCKTCVENQDVLLILNAIAMFLVLVLLFGYFFARVSKSRIEAVQSTNKSNLLPSSPTKSSSSPMSSSPMSSSLMSSSTKTPSTNTNQTCSLPSSTNTIQTPIIGQNPFSYSDSIDIISKI